MEKDKAALSQQGCLPISQPRRVAVDLPCAYTGKQLPLPCGCEMSPAGTAELLRGSPGCETEPTDPWHREPGCDSPSTEGMLCLPHGAFSSSLWSSIQLDKGERELGAGRAAQQRQQGARDERAQRGGGASAAASAQRRPTEPVPGFVPPHLPAAEMDQVQCWGLGSKQMCCRRKGNFLSCSSIFYYVSYTHISCKWLSPKPCLGWPLSP